MLEFQPKVNIWIYKSTPSKKPAVKIYKDIISGSLSNRPALDQLLNDVNKNDVIIIWKLDRLGRSLKNLVDLINSNFAAKKH